MKKIHFLMCFLTLALTFSGCNPSDSSSSSQNDTTFAQNFGSAVSKDFIGQVVDTDNHPIQNAEIKIGTFTVQTDANGVFIINGASVHEKFAYITATKAGYIDGSRAMVPTSGKNNVRIMLIPNTPLQTIQSGVDSEVALPNGTKVAFDGAFQDENGTAYTGTVSVSMFHLLPSNENISKLMPGMLYAQTKTNEEAVLETFGMLNVELRGSAGQKLNIKEGHTAKITMKIDDTQLATSPNSIPLWHFDEEKGYWKEDGVATKVGNNYVGEVSHFSWWNYDIFSSVVNLTVTVVDAEGIPINNTGVGLVVNTTNFNSYVRSTSNNGQVSGFVPANQALTINVYDYCGNIIYTSSIGPFATNTVLPNIVITSAMEQSTIVQGTLLKCDNTNVTNGYIILHNGSQNYLGAVIADNGSFRFKSLICNGSNTFTLEGFDYDLQQTTGLITYTFTLPTTSIGTLMTCSSISEFISFTIGNNPTVVILTNLGCDGNSGGTGSGTHLGGETVDNYGNLLHKLDIWGSPTVPGTYTSSDFSMEGEQDFGGILSDPYASIQYNLNHVGPIGSYYDMTFSGTYITSTGQQTIVGTVHVKRDY